MTKSIKKFIISTLIFLLMISSICFPVNATELTSDVDKTPPSDVVISEEEVVTDTTKSTNDRDVSDEEIEEKYNIVNNNSEDIKDNNVEQNNETASNVSENDTPDSIQELTIDENAATGFVFIEIQAADDFNYQVQAIVLNEKTQQMKTIPIYSSNNYVGKQELPVGEYKVVEVSVPNDLKGEFQFESGQTFEITDGSSVQVVSKQSDLIEVKETKKEKTDDDNKKEIKKEEKKENSIVEFIKEYIGVIIIAIIICIVAKIIYDKSQNMSDDE